jgi:hypothetical protein
MGRKEALLPVFVGDWGDCKRLVWCYEKDRRVSWGKCTYPWLLYWLLCSTLPKIRSPSSLACNRLQALILPPPNNSASCVGHEDFSFNALSLALHGRRVWHSCIFVAYLLSLLSATLPKCYLPIRLDVFAVWKRLTSLKRCSYSGSLD